MSVSENTQHWSQRLRAEVSTVSRGDWRLYASMQSCEIESGYVLDDAARVARRKCMKGMVGLLPGTSGVRSLLGRQGSVAG
jgi:hypothetical protein